MLVVCVIAGAAIGTALLVGIFALGYHTGMKRLKAVYDLI